MVRGKVSRELLKELLYATMYKALKIYGVCATVKQRRSATAVSHKPALLLPVVQLLAPVQQLALVF
jgi:hypothetical protein